MVKVQGKAGRLHQNFPDPAKAKGNETDLLRAFHDCRDQIDTYIKRFARALKDLD